VGGLQDITQRSFGSWGIKVFFLFQRKKKYKKRMKIFNCQSPPSPTLGATPTFYFHIKIYLFENLILL
jgi:hypothetical protein